MNASPYGEISYWETHWVNFETLVYGMQQAVDDASNLIHCDKRAMFEAYNGYFV